MHSKPWITVILGAVLLSGAVWAGDEEFIGKISEAHGKVDAMGAAKEWGLTGVLKWYMGGLAKYDYTVKVRFPDQYRMWLEGFEGTFSKSGRFVQGSKGWIFQQDATRPMASDEVESIKDLLLDLDVLGRLKRGEQKFERLPDSKFEEVECASIRLLGDEDREIKLHFDKSSWLLYRRDETVTKRAGEVQAEYTIFEDYEEMEGQQVALTRTTYVNQLIQGTKEEKFQLVEKIMVDEFTFSPEIAEGDFTAPEDPFTVRGLSPEEGKARAEKLLEFFKGRRNPNLAGWACRALAELQARDALKTLEDSDNKDLQHYGYQALIRMGSQTGVPEEHQARAWKKKVDQALGYPAGKGGIAVKFAGAAGARVDIDGTSLFFDAFFQPGLFNTAYPAIDPGSVVQAGLLLVTHAHRDHFDPRITANVAKRTKAKVVAPPTVLAMLKKEGVPEDQLVAVSPTEEKPASVTVGKARVTAFAVPPSGKFTKTGKPEHVVFLVQVGEKKLLHFGDAGDPKPLQEIESVRGADVIFLPHWMLKHKHLEVFKILVPRYMVPTRFMDTPGSYGSMKNLRDIFKKIVPLLPGHEVEF